MCVKDSMKQYFSIESSSKGDNGHARYINVRCHYLAMEKQELLREAYTTGKLNISAQHLSDFHVNGAELGMLKNVTELSLQANRFHEIPKFKNSRTSSSQPCEYYPSVYTVATGHGYVTELLVKGEANAECSNQYCIGCCHLNTETECL